MMRFLDGSDATGVGSGLIAGLALAEILHAGIGLSIGVVAAALAGAGDRTVHGWVAKLLGPMAALFLISRLLAGDNCLDLLDIHQVDTGGIVVTAAGFAWLLAVVINAPSGNPFLNRGFNAFVLLFALAELGSFILSPAGIPVVLISPAPVTTLAVVVVIGFGIIGGFDPTRAIELAGWTLALAQFFIAIYLLSGALGHCAQQSLGSVAMGLAAAVGSGVVGRFVR